MAKNPICFIFREGGEEEMRIPWENRFENIEKWKTSNNKNYKKHKIKENWIIKEDVEECKLYF